MDNQNIKEILDNVKKCCDITKDQSFTVYQRQDILALLDYITYLQEELKYQEHAELEYNEKHTKLMEKYKEAQQENKQLKERVAYLERSNDRREDTILGLRQELVTKKENNNGRKPKSAKY